MVGVGAGVEGGDAEAVAVADGGAVQLGESPVRGARVDLHFEVEGARQFQAPVALAGTGAAGEADVGVAGLQIVRVEVRGLARADGEARALVSRAVGADRDDVDGAGLVGEVDDPDYPVGAGVGGGGEQRHDVRGRTLLGARHRRKGGKSNSDQRAGQAADRVLAIDFHKRADPCAAKASPTPFGPVQTILSLWIHRARDLVSRNETIRHRPLCHRRSAPSCDSAVEQWRLSHKYSLMGTVHAMPD